MKTYSRVLSGLLALLLLLLCAACSQGSQPDDGTAATTASAGATDPAATEASTVDENGYLLDTLPADLTFPDTTVRVLYWEDVENPEYFAEEITTETVNDAIYRRNEMVRKRLGIEFDFVPTPGDSGNAAKFYSFVDAAVKGGDKYDIISAHSRSIGLCAYHSLTQDLLPLDYLDLEKPWWQDSLLNDATINGQLHFVSGDISTNMLYMMYVVFYNKEMLGTYNLEDPFTVVRNNEWTIDKMIEMSTGIYQDLDNDEKKSAGDRYGQAVKVLHADAFLWGSNIFGTEVNPSGDLVLTDDFKGEKCTALIDKLYKYMMVDQDAILYEDGNDYKNIFRDGRSLFITDRADIAINDLNDKEFDMGIVPIPKYDAEQEEFRTIIGNPFSLYAIPTNAANPDMSAAVLECLASESFRRVTPAIFELTMKVRYSYDNNDSMMYDLARDGAVYDLSRIFWKVFSSASCDAPDTRFENALFSGVGTWVSNLSRSQRLIELVLKSINDAF